MRKTKIVCTIGPACEDLVSLREMVLSGMNVARLNFSHGTHEDHSIIIDRLRTLSDELKMPVAIMQDLQGPKVRIGLLDKPFPVSKDQEVVIGKDFSIDFNIYDSVKIGERILIEDGLIELSVIAKTDAVPGILNSPTITCKVITGGLVQSHKGVNIPDSTIHFPVITEKDIDDLRFGLGHNIDAVAVSFVRNKNDILTVRDLIEKNNIQTGDMPLILAKIEKKEAITFFDEILGAADGIMVARGDLGVELPEEEITVLQKEIVEKCRRAGKPVIVATQMLESMVHNPKPTRAEVGDVSNAVIDSVDCVMLSEETANGSYPVEAVKEMSSIIDTIESSVFAEHISEILSRMEINIPTQSDPVSEKIRTPISSVESLNSAEKVAQTRPHGTIILQTKSKKIWNQASFIWGVKSELV